MNDHTFTHSVGQIFRSSWRTTSRVLRPRIVLAAAALALMNGLNAHSRAQDAEPRATAAPDDPDRDYWEKAVVLYHDDDNNEWSLRVMSDSVKERTSFLLDGVWRLDPQTKKWILLGKENETRPLLPASEQQPEDDKRQLAAPLDVIAKGSFGIFYMKWTVEPHIHGATFLRLGRTTARHISDRPKAPQGFYWTVVPLSDEKAEEMMIPDPRIACRVGETPGTQPAP